MKSISFKYWTNLMSCGCGGNVGSEATIELSDDDIKLFEESIEPARKERDVIGYFNEHLPASLASTIESAVYDSFRRYMAEDTLCNIGEEALPDLPQDELDELSWDEKVDLLLEDCSSDLDIVIVDIEIVNE